MKVYIFGEKEFFFVRLVNYFYNFAFEYLSFWNEFSCDTR